MKENKHSEGVNRRNRNSRDNHGQKEMSEIRDPSGKKSINTYLHALEDLQLKPGLSKQQSGKAVEVVIGLNFILFVLIL